MGRAETPCRGCEIDRDHSGVTHVAGGGHISNWGRPRSQSGNGKRPRIAPGSTYRNVPPPQKNSSQAYLDASERILQLMVTAALRE
jgi:hypothetical protein